MKVYKKLKGIEITEADDVVVVGEHCDQSFLDNQSNFRWKVGWRRGRPVSGMKRICSMRFGKDKYNVFRPIEVYEPTRIPLNPARSQPLPLP